jgi:uncharacterized protein (DUF952 family)
MATIWHLTDPGTWAAAQDSGLFTSSTRGATVDEVGFIHGSYAHQVARVTSFLFADVDGPMVLVGFAPELLAERGFEVRDEPGDPDDPEPFPHIYGGPLPLDVVVDVRQVTVSAGALENWSPDR